MAFHIHAEPRLGSRGITGLLGALFKKPLGPCDRRCNQFGAAVLQRHGHATQGRPRGNVAAHDAGPDDMHMPERQRRFATQTFEAVLQHEDANQVACGGPVHEGRNRLRLGRVTLRAGGAVTAPEVDDGIGSGVVFGDDFRAQRAAQLLGDKGAYERQIQQPLHERCRAARRCLQCKCLGVLLEFRSRYQRIDQPRRERPCGVEGLALEHQVHRRAHPEQAHRAYRATKSRMNPELHFRQPQRQLAVIGTHAVGTGERELEAATQRKALYRGHAREG